MRVGVDRLRSKIVTMAALTRALAEKATALAPTQENERLQALANLADDAATDALHEANFLLEVALAK
jgi:hypothetical protein